MNDKGKKGKVLTDLTKSMRTLSFKRFNLAEIPVINLDNQILAGHQRIAILIELDGGDELIDVRVSNRQLKKKEADEYLIRSNKNTGDWDINILKKAFNFDFLKEVGFTDFGSLEFQRYNETERLILYFRLHLGKEIPMRTGIPKYQIERFVKTIRTYGYEELS